MGALWVEQMKKIKARFDLEVIDRIISDKSDAAVAGRCNRTAETLNP